MMCAMMFVCRCVIFRTWEVLCALCACVGRVGVRPCFSPHHGQSVHVSFVCRTDFFTPECHSRALPTSEARFSSIPARDRVGIIITDRAMPGSGYGVRWVHPCRCGSGGAQWLPLSHTHTTRSGENPERSRSVGARLRLIPAHSARGRGHAAWGGGASTAVGQDVRRG